MAAQRDDVATATASTASSKATETLSQFLARILNQLALSAWLPSASLVGLTAFVLRLGSVLDMHPGQAGSSGPATAINRTFDSLSHTTIGGALIAVGAVIVGTTVTQAFSFETIRILEGYWGTNRWVEQVARFRCHHYRGLRDSLDHRYKDLTRQAWHGARKQIEMEEGGQMLREEEPSLTMKMIDALEVMVVGDRTEPIDEKSLARVRDYNWKQYAPPDVLRRQANIAKRRQDFPERTHVMPTRLGNVLRKFEDDTQWGTVESKVQELFDALPFSLQLEHDEQRTRLDLYCSTVFVTVTVTMLAVARFAADYPGYAAAAAGVGLIGTWLMYGAAIASARGYGTLLVTIANWDRRREPTSTRRAGGGRIHRAASPRTVAR